MAGLFCGGDDFAGSDGELVFIFTFVREMVCIDSRSLCSTCLNLHAGLHSQAFVRMSFARGICVNFFHVFKTLIIS